MKIIKQISNQVNFQNMYIIYIWLDLQYCDRKIETYCKFLVDHFKMICNWFRPFQRNAIITHISSLQKEHLESNWKIICNFWFSKVCFLLVCSSSKPKVLSSRVCLIHLLKNWVHVIVFWSNVCLATQSTMLQLVKWK